MEHPLDRLAAAQRGAAADEDGLGEQVAEAGEVAVVDQFGVPRDQVLDGSVVGCGQVGHGAFSARPRRGTRRRRGSRRAS
ncbi:hypothetical protein [Kitasatospora sp. NPDC094011]|uniref:hypothetical protein n=1 Tax=Kitasatospora sp. NPDC094011 TaxID=3364090 RepID=UPI00381CF247